MKPVVYAASRPEFIRLFGIHLFGFLLSGIIIFSLFPIFRPVQAGTAGWVPQGSGPGGTSIFAIAVDPQTPSTLYAGTDQGIYKSTNGGATWVNSTNDMLTSYGNVPRINTIAIHSVSSNVLYAGSNGGGGIFKSVDGGSSWVQINNGLTTPYVETIIIDPQNPTVLYAGTYGGDGKGGIFKSIDNGQSWAAINSGFSLPAFVYSIILDSQDQNTLYADLDGVGIYKSTDGGKIWTPYNTQLEVKLSHILVKDPETTSTMYLGTHSGVLKSIDGGTTFTEINQGIESNPNITAIWLADSKTIYIGTEGDGIYKSIDAGYSWVKSSSGVDSSYIQSLVGVINNSSIIYAGTSGGVFKTLDNGDDWNGQNYGFPAAKTEALLLLPQEPYTFFAGTDGGIYRHQENHWVSSSSGISNSWIRSLAYDPETPTTFYASTFYGDVYKSIDSGLSWTAPGIGLPTSDIQEIIVNPLHSKILYAASSQGVYKSQDGGDHWSRTNPWTEDGIHIVSSLSIDANQTETLYAGTIMDGAYKTKDEGQNWIRINNGFSTPKPTVRQMTIDPRQSSIIYAGTEGSLYRSVDSGASWVATDLNWTATSILFNPSIPGTIYAGTEGMGVYKSVDNGLTWKSMTTSGIPNGEIYIYDLEYDPAMDMLYASTKYGTSVSKPGASDILLESLTSVFSAQNKNTLAKTNSVSYELYGVFALCESEECEARTTKKVFLPSIRR